MENFAYLTVICKKQTGKKKTQTNTQTKTPNAFTSSPKEKKKKLLISYFKNGSTNYGNESVQIYVNKVLNTVSSVLMFELFLQMRQQTFLLCMHSDVFLLACTKIPVLKPA